jgi:uncharacterized membrane protein (UPF0127 family)
MVACNLRNGKELSNNVIVADSILKRMKGLFGKSELPIGEALWIKPCMSVHTFFIRFPINVVFFEQEKSGDSCYKKPAAELYDTVGS